MKLNTMEGFMSLEVNRMDFSTYLTRDCAYALITNERRKILMDIRVNSSNLLSIYYA